MNTKVTINLKTINSNIAKVKKIIGQEVKICAVVKANAYSLGAREVARGITDSVDYFAVASLDEAKALRDCGIRTPILLLYVCSNYKLAKKLNCQVTITSLIEAMQLAKSGCVLDVHVKINTGMNRFGIKTLVELSQTIDILKTSNCNIVGFYTHLAKEEKQPIKQQLKVFQVFANYIKELYPSALIHTAASGGLKEKTAHFDMVRIGKAMYGGMEGFKTAIKIKSKIIAVQRTLTSEGIGYNGEPQKTSKLIGVLGVGYADCFHRNNSNKGVILINKKPSVVCGNVCMDCFMGEIDSSVKVGDWAVLMDNKKGIRLMDISRRSSTIACELLCALNFKRCKVVYKQ
ncbi:MAG: alanine racemase [Firmicutes bacterium]|nr:alanine racemase [Bacillota bacterium]